MRFCIVFIFKSFVKVLNLIQMQVKSMFPFDLGSAFKNLSEYLTTIDKLSLSSTCTLLRQIIRKSQTWQLFQINDFNLQQSKWRNYLDWIGRYIEIIQPRQLYFNICNQQHEKDQQLIDILLHKRQSVQVLTIRTNSTELHLALTNSCRCTKKLVLQSNIITDQLVQIMCQKMIHINQLQIHTDAEYTAQNISEYIKGPFERLILKPYQLNFSQILQLVQNEQLNEINQLQIDVEQCQETILIDIVRNLKHIRKLRLYHLQQFNDPEYSKILADKLSIEIEELTLTKCKLDMIPIMTKITSPLLQYLDLTQASLLRDESIKLLAKSCPNLKLLNISWCNQITNKSIVQVVNKCTKIQRLILTGLKSINDQCFQEYVGLKQQFMEKRYNQVKYQFMKACKNKKQSQMPKIYEQFHEKTINSIFFSKMLSQKNTLNNLRCLQCISCNNISDTILKIIYCFNRMAQVINYYGDDQSLSRRSFQDDFYD